MTRRFDVILTPFSREYKNILQQLINKLLGIITIKKQLFLGMLLTKEETSTSTTLYRKPTNTGLLLHNHSHTDKRNKRGLIKTMLHRAKRLSSSPSHLVWNAIRCFQPSYS